VRQNTLPIGIYKRHTENNNTQPNFVSGQTPQSKASNMGTRSDDTSPKKSYVWLHPPKKIELNIHDQLFVLCEKREKENQFDKNKGKIDAGAGNQSNIEQTMKADGTRV